MKTETDQIVIDEKSTIVEAQQKQSQSINLDKDSKPLECSNEEEEKYYFDDARYSQGNECVFICAEKSCKQNAIVCGDRKCPCRKLHRKNGTVCHLTNPQTMAKKLESKIIQKPVIKSELKKLDSLLSKVIDEISEFQERLQYLGLNNEERIFLNLVHQKRYQEMKGCLVHGIDQSNLDSRIEESQLFNCDDVAKQFQNLNKHLYTEMSLQIHRISNVVDKRISWIKNKALEDKYKESENLGRIDKYSQFGKKKLIESTMISENLSKFFNKKVKGYLLIYRASQNNFSTQAFWEAYNGQANTLFLIKTQSDKVIGGFTPLVWVTDQGTKTQSDPSKQSFVFSLTNNDKLSLIDSSCAILFCGKSTGPCFGASCWSTSTLSINNNSNTQYNNVALYSCKYYQNTKYTAQNKQSYRFFSGSTDSRFTVKQWQAFQVIFDE